MSKFANIKVGLTIIAGLTAILIFIVIIGTESSLFAKKYHLKVFVENVQGLAKGGMVSLGGLKVGIIDDFEFTNLNGKNGINVLLTINENFKDKITTSSVANIKTIGLLGDNFIDISIGSTNEASLASNSYLPVHISDDLSTLISVIKTELPEFSATAKSFRLLAEDIRAGKGTAGKLVENDELYNKLNATVASIQKFTVSLSDNKGLLSKVLHDKNLSDTIEFTLNNLNKFSNLLANNKSSIGKLISNDSLYNSLSRVANQADSFMNKLNNTNSTVGKMMNETDLYNQINETLKSINVLIEDINKNPKKYVNVSVF